MDAEGFYQFVARLFAWGSESKAAFCMGLMFGGLVTGLINRWLSTHRRERTSADRELIQSLRDSLSESARLVPELAAARKEIHKLELELTRALGQAERWKDHAGRGDLEVAGSRLESERAAELNGELRVSLEEARLRVQVTEARLQEHLVGLTEMSRRLVDLRHFCEAMLRESSDCLNALSEQLSFSHDLLLAFRERPSISQEVVYKALGSRTHFEEALERYTRDLDRLS